MMTGYTEIHSHFVYGVDDGAGTQEDMFRMLDAAWQNGVNVLYATSHQVPGMEQFREREYQLHLEEARAYCAQQGYAMDLRAGAEILYTPQLDHYIKDHPLQTLNDTDMVLLEFSPMIPLDGIRRALDVMEQYRYTPILAHIERYKCLLKGNTCEKLAREYSVQFQVNSRTVISPSQPLLQRMLISGWFKKKLIDYVASDAHNTTNRSFLTSEAHEALAAKVGADYADQLLGKQK